MSLNTTNFLVNVPALNPGSAPDAPSAVRFLNPGVPVPGHDASLYKPDNLPMNDAVVKAMLAQFAQLARETKNLGDISALVSGHFENFFSGTSFAIKDDLRAALSGSAREIEMRKALSRAQTELCLAWALEDAAFELASLKDKLDAQWSTFEKSLGLEEEDALEGSAAALAGAKPDLTPDGPKIPLAVLMESILAFVPDGQGLYCADENILADWAEYGVAFSEASAETLARFGLEGEWRQALAPGYTLCLNKRPDASKPWLDAVRLIVSPGGK
ncbi:MAG: hypothetical protein HY795_17800 [Desulfovibrio sp.]|nr:hypothetical protein [Desulfovibrio sp.]MBI4959925.1 hypothetical protein [Desulfovibrio sp.]